jgi:hypothetical protein
VGSKVALLGKFAKLRKETISFLMPVRPSIRPSVRPHGTTRLPLEGLSLNLIFGYFLENLERKFEFSSQFAKNNGYFYINIKMHL